jgi:cytochrome c5
VRTEKEISMRELKILAAALAAALPLAATPAATKTGKQVYEEVCVSCHGIGRDGAPKVGDVKAWHKLESRGLSGLTASALEGVRKMPPHGGRLTLSDLEIKRAITHMVNHSGGHWTEPVDRSHLPAARSGAAIVKSQCVKCHEKGLDGAPRIGDREAWVARAKPGFDSLVRSAINGHGAMPARGGMADLTDSEMRSAITYMFQESTKPPKK